jgi:hypothetical protein
MNASIQSSQVDFEILLLPYGDERSRESSLRQLQQSLEHPAAEGITEAQLKRLLAAYCDEDVDQELSLQELEELSGGVGLVDAMVSSSILMVIVSQSAGLFGNSMNALNSSQLRDGINGAISADIELVRQDVADWASESSMDGQLTYAPDVAECDAGTLGEALLNDQNSGLSSGTTQVSLRNAPNKLQGVQINRTISVDPDNANLIRISYVTADGSAISVNQSTTLATPAQGWCA